MPGAIGSKNMAAEARELVIPVLTEVQVGVTVTMRIQPPPSADWLLVKVTTEIVSFYGVTDTATIGLRTAAGVDLFTPVVRNNQANGVRATLPLLGTEDQRTAKGSINNYHEVYLTTTGSGNFGKEQMFLYYRRVQPSGPISGARQS